jgi:hypothetical protein
MGSFVVAVAVVRHRLVEVRHLVVDTLDFAAAAVGILYSAVADPNLDQVLDEEAVVGHMSDLAVAEVVVRNSAQVAVVDYIQVWVLDSVQVRSYYRRQVVVADCRHKLATVPVVLLAADSQLVVLLLVDFVRMLHP